MMNDAREEDAEGMLRPKEKDSRCRVTECNRGMGDDCIGFCGREETERDGRN